jgi:hypothetical protein
MSIHLPNNQSVEEWQLAIWNADDKLLSRPQKLELMLIMDARFNQFDPFRVVGDLLANRHLWDGALMTRGYTAEDDAGKYKMTRLQSDLIALRDLPRGHWNVETLFITHQPENTVAITTLAGTWLADNIDFETEDGAADLLGCSPPDCSILAVWWD